jgi:hypothetical protein
MRGLSAGFGIVGFAGAALFLLVAALGFRELWRRNWLLALMLALPVLLTTAGLLLAGFHFTPRFFLLGMPLAMLCLVACVDTAAGIIGRRLEVSEAKLAVAAVAAVCIMSLASLPLYYRHPKQNFRGAIQYVEERRAAGEIVLSLYLADSGYRFYGPRYGLVENKDFFPVRSLQALETMLHDHPDGRTWVVMTFPRILRLAQPDLYMRIQREWSRQQTFPGSIGDGDVSVWVSKVSASRAASGDVSPPSRLTVSD